MKPDPFEMTVTQSIAQAEAVGDKARAEHAREALRRHRLARLEKARRAAENVDAADLRRWEKQPGA